MLTVDWEPRFRRIFDLAAANYRAGIRGADVLFDPMEVAFLRSIDCRPQELYDLVEDWCQYGEPSPEVAVRLTAVRRNYFMTEQGGRWTDRVEPAESFPPKDAELGGFAWLPRIIAKARAKLRGELPPELMYGCAGDRRFLQEIGSDPVEFLRLVWQAENHDARILEFVRQRARRR